MSTVILLDAGPLGLVTNPRGAQDALNCRIWLESLLLKGIKVKVPAIADYEVRRSLLLYNKTSGIQSLNEWRTRIGYIPVTSDAWLEAARLWAQVRKQGLPTADNKTLDGDVILAAQARMIERDGYEVIVATMNVRHLSRLVVAREWRDILC